MKRKKTLKQCINQVTKNTVLFEIRRKKVFYFIVIAALFLWIGYLIYQVRNLTLNGASRVPRGMNPYSINTKRFINRNKDMGINLGNILQKTFLELQNPTNCTNQKYLMCSMNQCGFGCQMLFFAYCLNEALILNRTFVLDDSEWKYRTNGYEAYFEPVSDTCTKFNKSEFILRTRKNNLTDHQKISVYHFAGLATQPDYSKYFISDRHRNIIRKFNSQPLLWWIGQSLKYLMRWKPYFVNDLKLNKQRPIVGVHIRRTDKGSEADFYPVEDYMQEVENFFNLHSSLNPKEKFTNKTIYLATDDPAVLNEIKSKYTEYNVRYDLDSIVAANKNRESQSSLEGLLKDLYILYNCDYVVCTLSSNLCRMVYALMQTKYVDATWRLKSLDSDFFLDIHAPQEETAIYEHIPNNQNELEIKMDDVVRINFYIPTHLVMPRVRKFIFDNYKNGTNLRTNKTGLYPAYKTIE